MPHMDFKLTVVSRMPRMQAMPSGWRCVGAAAGSGVPAAWLDGQSWGWWHAGSLLGDTPGKIVPHCKHGRAIVALPVKIRPKSGVFTLLCMSDMMVLGSSKSWERRDRDAAEQCHCAVSFGGCLAETLWAMRIGADADPSSLLCYQKGLINSPLLAGESGLLCDSSYLSPDVDFFHVCLFANRDFYPADGCRR